MNLEKNDINNQEISGQININKFFSIITNPTETNQILEKFTDTLNEYYMLNSALANQLKELLFRFNKKKCGPNLINTSIYNLESVIEKIINIQLESLKVIISKIDVINLIGNDFMKLKKLIEELSPKFTNNSYNISISKEFNSVLDSLMSKMNKLELKVIDDYIWQKYNKHVQDSSDIGINELISDIKYFEKTFYDYVQEKKSQYYQQLKESDSKIENVFSEIKNDIANYISALKEGNNYLIIGLDNLKGELVSKTLNKEKKGNENLIISKSDFDLNEKDINTVKYRIKIIKNNKISLQNINECLKKEEINKKEIQKSSKSSENKNQKDEQIKKPNTDNLFLNDRDIYEIVSKLYSYDIKIMDKSHYDLEAEKGRLNATDLTNRILAYNDDNEETKNTLDEKYSELIESINNQILNNIVNIESFFIALNNYRVSGKTKFTEKFFELIIYIYTKTEEELLKNNKIKLADLMLILSQTYFKEINGKKIYILEEIKMHELYKKLEFWKNIIIKKIDDEFKTCKNINQKNNSNNKLTKERKEDLITTKLIPFSDLMKEYGFNNDKIRELYEQIFDKYKCSKPLKDQIISYINQNQEK